MQNSGNTNKTIYLKSVKEEIDTFTQLQVQKICESTIPDEVDPASIDYLGRNLFNTGEDFVFNLNTSLTKTNGYGYVYDEGVTKYIRKQKETINKLVEQKIKQLNIKKSNHFNIIENDTNKKED